MKSRSFWNDKLSFYFLSEISLEKILERLYIRIKLFWMYEKLVSRLTQKILKNCYILFDTLM